MTIQTRMNGAIAAASRIHLRMGKVCHALAVSPSLACEPSVRPSDD